MVGTLRFAHPTALKYAVVPANAGTHRARTLVFALERKPFPFAPGVRDDPAERMCAELLRRCRRPLPDAVEPGNDIGVGGVQRLADLIDCAAPAGERLRVVHIGGAGLTLPRYVAATRPQSAQVVFEPDVELTDFVRTHLPLPARSGIKVRAADGRSGLAALRDAYADIVVVDAFAPNTCSRSPHNCPTPSMQSAPSATAAARSANTSPGAYTHGPR